MKPLTIKKPTGWQRKATLLFKSEKLLGAEAIFAYFSTLSISEMKATTITSQLQIFDALTMPADMQTDNEPKRLKDLHSHFARLQQEFLGKSLLCLYHAVLIVLLRRNFQPAITYQTFENLWQSEQDYLFKHLSLRWLVSAADTFVDFSPNPTRQAIFLNVATLINTLKVYETKLDLLGNPQHLMDEKIHTHQQQHLALYDGLHYFRLGTDDTLQNMRQRYAKFSQVDNFATQFLLLVFDRLQVEQTAFSLMRQLHTHSKSAWWAND